MATSDAVAEFQGPNKHKNISELADYSVIPESSYWENFPFKELLSKPTMKVDTEKLTELLHKRKNLLKRSEWERGMKAVHNLKFGAPSHQRSELPVVMCKNSD